MCIIVFKPAVCGAPGARKVAEKDEVLADGNKSGFFQSVTETLKMYLRSLQHHQECEIQSPDSPHPSHSKAARLPYLHQDLPSKIFISRSPKPINLIRTNCGIPEQLCLFSAVRDSVGFTKFYNKCTSEHTSPGAAVEGMSSLWELASAPLVVLNDCHGSVHNTHPCSISSCETLCNGGQMNLRDIFITSTSHRTELQESLLVDGVCDFTSLHWEENTVHCSSMEPSDKEGGGSGQGSSGGGKKQKTESESSNSSSQQSGSGSRSSQKAGKSRSNSGSSDSSGDNGDDDKRRRPHRRGGGSSSKDSKPKLMDEDDEATDSADEGVEEEEEEEEEEDTPNNMIVDFNSSPRSTQSGSGNDHTPSETRTSIFPSTYPRHEGSEELESSSDHPPGIAPLGGGDPGGVGVGGSSGTITVESMRPSANALELSNTINMIVGYGVPASIVPQGIGKSSLQVMDKSPPGSGLGTPTLDSPFPLAGEEKSISLAAPVTMTPVLSPALNLLPQLSSSNVQTSAMLHGTIGETCVPIGTTSIPPPPTLANAAGRFNPLPFETTWGWQPPYSPFPLTTSHPGSVASTPVPASTDTGGYLRPGTATNLSATVCQESDGVLIISVRWRNRNYSGSLIDIGHHEWAPPRLSCPYTDKAINLYKQQETENQQVNVMEVEEEELTTKDPPPQTILKKVNRGKDIVKKMKHKHDDRMEEENGCSVFHDHKDTDGVNEGYGRRESLTLMPKQRQESHFSDISDPSDNEGSDNKPIENNATIPAPSSLPVSSQDHTLPASVMPMALLQPSSSQMSSIFSLSGRNNGILSYPVPPDVHTAQLPSFGSVGLNTKQSLPLSSSAVHADRVNNELTLASNESKQLRLQSSESIVATPPDSPTNRDGNNNLSSSSAPVIRSNLMKSYRQTTAGLPQGVSVNPPGQDHRHSIASSKPLLSSLPLGVVGSSSDSGGMLSSKSNGTDFPEENPTAHLDSLHTLVNVAATREPMLHSNRRIKSRRSVSPSPKSTVSKPPHSPSPSRLNIPDEKGSAAAFSLNSSASSLLPPESEERLAAGPSIVKPVGSQATCSWGMEHAGEDGHDSDSSGSGSLISTHRTKGSHRKKRRSDLGGIKMPASKDEDGSKQPQTPSFGPIPYSTFKLKIQPISPGVETSSLSMHHQKEVSLQQQQVAKSFASMHNSHGSVMPSISIPQSVEPCKKHVTPPPSIPPSLPHPQHTPGGRVPTPPMATKMPSQQQYHQHTPTVGDYLQKLSPSHPGSSSSHVVMTTSTMSHSKEASLKPPLGAVESSYGGMEQDKELKRNAGGTLPAGFVSVGHRGGGGGGTHLSSGNIKNHPVIQIPLEVPSSNSGKGIGGGGGGKIYSSNTHTPPPPPSAPSSGGSGLNGTAAKRPKKRSRIEAMGGETSANKRPSNDSDDNSTPPPAPPSLYSVKHHQSLPPAVAKTILEPHINNSKEHRNEKLKETFPPGFDFDPNIPMNLDYQIIAFKNQQQKLDSRQERSATSSKTFGGTSGGGVNIQHHMPPASMAAQLREYDGGKKPEYPNSQSGAPSNSPQQQQQQHILGVASPSPPSSSAPKVVWSSNSLPSYNSPVIQISSNHQMIKTEPEDSRFPPGHNRFGGGGGPNSIGAHTPSNTSLRTDSNSLGGHSTSSSSSSSMRNAHSPHSTTSLRGGNKPRDGGRKPSGNSSVRRPEPMHMKTEDEGWQTVTSGASSKQLQQHGTIADHHHLHQLHLQREKEKGKLDKHTPVIAIGKQDSLPPPVPPGHMVGRTSPSPGRKQHEWPPRAFTPSSTVHGFPSHSSRPSTSSPHHVSRGEGHTLVVSKSEREKETSRHVTGSYPSYSERHGGREGESREKHINSHHRQNSTSSTSSNHSTSTTPSTSRPSNKQQQQQQQQQPSQPPSQQTEANAMALAQLQQHQIQQHIQRAQMALQIQQLSPTALAQIQRNGFNLEDYMKQMQNPNDQMIMWQLMHAQAAQAQAAQAQIAGGMPLDMNMLQLSAMFQQQQVQAAQAQAAQAQAAQAQAAQAQAAQAQAAQAQAAQVQAAQAQAAQVQAAQVQAAQVQAAQAQAAQAQELQAAMLQNATMIPFLHQMPGGGPHHLSMYDPNVLAAAGVLPFHPPTTMLQQKK